MASSTLGQGSITLSVNPYFGNKELKGGGGFEHLLCEIVVRFADFRMSLVAKLLLRISIRKVLKFTGTESV
jgi:hypothetical protein